VGVEVNKLQAASWYSKAAEKGNPNAADWCRRNGVIPASSTGR
jgi:TPR repeat protein